jgi:hypothetical protein
MDTGETAPSRVKNVARSGRAASDRLLAILVSTTVSVAPVSTIQVRFANDPTEQLTTIKYPGCSRKGTVCGSEWDLTPNEKAKRINRMAGFTTPPPAAAAVCLKLPAHCRGSPEEARRFPIRFVEISALSFSSAFLRLRGANFSLRRT